MQFARIGNELAQACLAGAASQRINATSKLRQSGRFKSTKIGGAPIHPGQQTCSIDLQSLANILHRRFGKASQLVKPSHAVSCVTVLANLLCYTSASAARRNFKLETKGFLSDFLGFLVILPWLVHASWHAYAETLDASA